MGANRTLNFLLRRTTITLRSLYVGGGAGVRNKTATRSTRKRLSQTFSSGGHMQPAVDLRLIDIEIVFVLNKDIFMITSFFLLI